MENFRTIFFPRTKVENKCESAANAGSRYDHYRKDSAVHAADKPQNEKTSGRNS